MSAPSEESASRHETAMDAASQTVQGLSILLAHQDASTMQALTEILEPRHAVRCKCSTIADLKKALRSSSIEMVITGVNFPDGNGIDAVVELGQDRPIATVVVAEQRSIDLVEKAMQNHVMAYLTEPVHAGDVDAAIVVAKARFTQLSALVDEVHSLRQALEDRKIIERAKGIIMQAGGLDEEQAFAELRTRAQNARMKLVQLAQGVLDYGASHAPGPTHSRNEAAS